MSKKLELQDQNLTPVDYQSDFDFESYIPFRIVQTQLWMHQILRPESNASVRSIANISKLESRIILVTAFNQSISPSQISENIGLDRATVARTLASLNTKGLVVTEILPKDQRRKCVHITEKGKEVCDALVSVLRRFDVHLNALLEEEEKQTLFRILDKLLSGSHEFTTPHGKYK